MTAPAHIRVDHAGAVTTVTIDRPEKRNALALRTLEEIRDAVAAACSNGTCRVIVLTGTGERAFASGADLDEVPDAMDGPDQARAYDEQVAELLYRPLLEAPLPVIARIGGSAIGGGLLLALTCDLRIAAADCRFAVPAARIGLMLSPLEYDLLSRHAGPSRARLLAYTGRRLGAHDALAYGLVDDVVDREGLDHAVSRLAGEIAAGAPLSIRASKRLIGRAGDAEGVTRAYEEVYTSDDLREGLRAFAEKRDPRFEGR